MVFKEKDNKIFHNQLYYIVSTMISIFKIILCNKDKKIAELEFHIERLNHQLKKYRKATFSSKSEKQYNSNENNENTSDNSGSGNDNNKNDNYKTSKKKKTRKLNKTSKNSWFHNNIQNLREEEITLDIPSNQKICSCCNHNLSIIGHNITKKLSRKVEFFVKKFVRPKYACSHCEQNKVISQNLPEQIISGSPATPELLASITNDLYFKSLPIYRIQKSFNAYGLPIPESTLFGWLSTIAFLVKPIVTEMENDIITWSSKIHTDDTVLKILESSKKGKSHTGRIWVYLADNNNPIKATLFKYTSTREGKHPLNVLSKYSGFIQADAYSGYDALFNANQHIKEVACWAHARRKFYDIAVNEPKSSVSNIIISKISKLYLIEKHIKSFEPIYKKAYRKRYAKPKLKKLHQYLINLKNSNNFLPKSNLGQAISYVLNHWIALQRYLGEGILDIDNNKAEREMKNFVIGRKNFMFKANHRTGENTAILYSLVRTCNQYDINVEDYFTDILSRIPSMKISQIKELIPYNWVSKYDKIPKKQQIPSTLKLLFIKYQKIFKEL